MFSEYYCALIRDIKRNDHRLIDSTIYMCVATVFGQLWRLEPLPSEKKAMWQREMGWLLCVSDYIVELKPSWQTIPDGSKLEVILLRFPDTVAVELCMFYHRKCF